MLAIAYCSCARDLRGTTTLLTRFRPPTCIIWKPFGRKGAGSIGMFAIATPFAVDEQEWNGVSAGGGVEETGEVEVVFFSEEMNS